MNQKVFIFTMLLSLFVSMVSSAQLEIADDRAFVEILRKHGEHNTLREFADEFRKRIGQDNAGSLIKEISENPNLNSAIFLHLDAIPEKHVELVLANWLEDDTKWGSGGGFYYSPAGRIEHWLRVYISPQDSNDLKSNSALPFVLENRDIRRALAKVLRISYSDEELSSEERRERRTEAWGKIVDIVEQSFPRLIEEDNKRRAEAAKEPKPQPGEFLKKIKQRDPEGVAMNHANGQANIEADRWMWYFLAIAAILGVAGFLLRSRITTTRRRS